MAITEKDRQVPMRVDVPWRVRQAIKQAAVAKDVTMGRMIEMMLEQYEAVNHGKN